MSIHNVLFKIGPFCAIIIMNIFDSGFEKKWTSSINEELMYIIDEHDKNISQIEGSPVSFKSDLTDTTKFQYRISKSENSLKITFFSIVFIFSGLSVNTTQMWRPLTVGAFLLLLTTCFYGILSKYISETEPTKFEKEPIFRLNFGRYIYSLYPPQAITLLLNVLIIFCVIIV